MKLFSASDLARRWQYSKAGVSKLIKSKDFPQPIGTVNNGKTKIFEEADILVYEKNKPWLFDENQKRLRQNLYCSLAFAKDGDEKSKKRTLERLFRDNAKPWKEKTKNT